MACSTSVWSGGDESGCDTSSSHSSSHCSSSSTHKTCTSTYTRPPARVIRYQEQRSQYYVNTFRVMASPVTDLLSVTGKSEVTITYTHSDAQVCTLQWLGFRGLTGASGQAYIQINQDIPDTRGIVGTIESATFGTYKGVPVAGKVVISATGLYFYFNFSWTGPEISLGDAFSFAGGSISWICP